MKKHIEKVKQILWENEYNVLTEDLIKQIEYELKELEKDER